MPISDMERELMDLVKDLRAENAALVELLLTSQGHRATEVTQIPDKIEAIGKEPWYRRQQRLQQLFRKPKLSEVSGIPDELDEAAQVDYTFGDKPHAG